MKLTPWFVNGEKPVRDGVYQQMSGGNAKTLGYQRFEGGTWYTWGETPEAAAASKYQASIYCQSDRWRGLAEEPKQ